MLTEDRIQKALVNAGVTKDVAGLARWLLKMQFDPVRDIAEFHKKFELDYDGPPRELPIELAEFRVGFMSEELAEYTLGMTPQVVENVRWVFRDCLASAKTPEELAKKFDALVDLVYVAIGSAYLHGFDFREAWKRVHAANMQKERCRRATDSLRGSSYDVIKPPGWRAPSLIDLVQ